MNYSLLDAAAAAMDYKRETVNLPSSIANRDVITTKAAQAIYDKYAKEARRDMVTKGAARVEVVLSPDKQEQTVIIRSDAGKVLGGATFISTIATRDVGTYGLDWEEVFESD